MATDVILPQWGMTMTEGFIVAWLRAEGENVEEGDPLVEVEAEKTTDLVYAPATGTLWSIKVPPGETVEAGTRIGIILGPDEPPPVSGSPQLDDNSSATSPQPAGTRADAAHRHIEADRVGDAGGSSSSRGARQQVEPRARGLLREHGLDAASVRGTGPNGRVTEADVQQQLLESTDTPPTIVKLEGARDVIARRMMASLQEMAQLTITTQADVTELVEHQKSAQANGGASYTACVVRAVSLALLEHPRFNARVEGATVRHLEDIHVGVAISVEDVLVAPVVRHANRKTVEEISHEIGELAHRAGQGGLVSSDFESTFTVTNLGGHGVEFFTPIINPPEVAILGVGRVVETAARAESELIWRSLMPLSLTFDHRVVDGAPAAEFLQAVASGLRKTTALFAESEP